MIAYIGGLQGPRVGLGLLARRATILHYISTASGSQPEEVYVAPVRKRFPWILRYLGLQLALPRPVGHESTLFVEGLPLALGIARKARKQGWRVVVDVCDSWQLLAAVAVENHVLLRRTKARIKVTLARLVTSYVSSQADALIYIAERDKRIDSKLHGGKNVFVLPNRLPHADRARLILPASPTGHLCAVGDWSYPPNQQMLTNLENWLAQTNQPLELRIYGPNLDHQSSDSRIISVGWVDNIADAYSGALASISLIDSGAGVKNKVIEALMYGIPVIASPESREGIPFSEGLIPAELHSPNVALQIAKELCQRGFPPLEFPDSSDLFQKLLTQAGKGK